ncbi:MAG TPA: hypothetical protein VHL77_03080 [Ferruginibacter sp.]|jgi:hypothetical protein|nr:hypothetical protein [Ferruginibacter sp.]
MRKFLLPFFLLGTILMMLVMSRTSATLKTPSTPLGILNLEFAHNTDKATWILNAWSPHDGTDNISAAKTNTYWDFLFLFFYAGFLFLACNRIATAIGGSMDKPGRIIARGALLAGLLDVTENAGMLFTLNGHVSSTITFCTTFVSVIKWCLALIAVLYLITGLLVLAYRRIKY